MYPRFAGYLRVYSLSHQLWNRARLAQGTEIQLGDKLTVYATSCPAALDLNASTYAHHITWTCTKSLALLTKSSYFMLFPWGALSLTHVKITSLAHVIITSLKHVWHLVAGAVYCSIEHVASLLAILQADSFFAYFSYIYLMKLAPPVRNMWLRLRVAFGGRRMECYVAVWRCVAGAVPVRTTKIYKVLLRTTK